MDYLAMVENYRQDGRLPNNLAESLHDFYLSYRAALQHHGRAIEDYHPVLETFLELVLQQLQNPYSFEPYHRHITEPFNYYQFGLDLMRPLVLFEKSTASHLEQADRMVEQLNGKENVILFANHQTEPDPQAISLLLQNTHPHFAEEIIFIAGHRVISDPLAVPFSMGRNLLCIYSKKHIENPPENKAQKLQHNKKTMLKMGQLLSEGGHCIYVAPSGGRDRPNAEGVVEVAPFDPQSIEMFWLIAQQASRPTHFYPLALATYDLLPPPGSVKKELGERRYAQCTPIHLAFGQEIAMHEFPSQSDDKRQNRIVRAEYIWQLVVKAYQELIK